MDLFFLLLIWNILWVTACIVSWNQGYHSGKVAAYKGVLGMFEEKREGK